MNVKCCIFVLEKDEPEQKKRFKSTQIKYLVHSKLKLKYR